MSQHHNDGDGVWHAFGETSLPARAILVAAGTQPNTVLAREDAPHFHLDGKYFRLLDESGNVVKPLKGLAKPEKPAVLTEIRADGRATSFFGDLHPSFHGNVVKAMASATQGYPIVSRMLGRVEAASRERDAAFLARVDDELRATVERVERLTPTIVEVVVHAPAAARRFRPGQFYRLQNFETLSRAINGTRLTMEGIALTGAWVDRERGLVSTIVLEMGGSSDLCALLEPGEPVILMGPTGTPTEIAGGETVVLAGGGLGNAVLFSIGQAFRDAGSKVLYFAGYKQRDRPLQGRRDRSGGRCGRLVLRRSARVHADAAAGPRVRRQHRAGDGRLRFRCAGRRSRSTSRTAIASSRSAPTG